MFDAIDRFRHWLIRKLACGDMILLNFEMAEDRRMRPRNAGPVLVSGAELVVSPRLNAALYVGRNGPFDGCGLALQTDRFVLTDCHVRGI